MAKVCGTSDQARLLKQMMHQTMSKIESGVGEMEKAARNIESGWNDEGAGEVDEILSSIKNALRGAMEAAPQIEQALESYAAFLESI